MGNDHHRRIAVLIPLGWRAEAPRRLVGHHVPLFRIRADVSDIVEARRSAPYQYQPGIKPRLSRCTSMSVLGVTTFADAYDYDIREWDSVEVLRQVRPGHFT
jgi:hypothetical protein